MITYLTLRYGLKDILNDKIMELANRCVVSRDCGRWLEGKEANCVYEELSLRQIL
jgi:hypothetical protein